MFNNLLGENSTWSDDDDKSQDFTHKNNEVLQFQVKDPQSKVKRSERKKVKPVVENPSNLNSESKPSSMKLDAPEFTPFLSKVQK